MAGFFSQPQTPAIPPPPIAPTSSINQAAADALTNKTAVDQNKKRGQAANDLTGNAASQQGQALNASPTGQSLI